MPDFVLDHLLLTKTYRFCRRMMLTLAALYIATVGINAAQYRGASLGIIGFTLQALKADVVETLSVTSYMLFDYGLGASSRPTRYALICEATGQATEADNAATERQVGAQLVENKSGVIYNSMAAAFERGESQPVFILSKFAPGGANLCAVTQYRRQECTCSGKYNATERSRIPASDLFGPRKAL